MYQMGLWIVNFIIWSIVLGFDIAKYRSGQQPSWADVFLPEVVTLILLIDLIIQSI